MPEERNYPEIGYRYGFNGKENDDEVKGAGNQQNYGERIYDPRLGRFLSVDPLAKDYPELTTYQFASNNPIFNIDRDGLEGDPYYFMMEGFRQYLDAAVNAFTFNSELSGSVSKINAEQNVGDVSFTTKVTVTNSTTMSYSGWDLFKPSAYKTSSSIPSPKGGFKNTTTAVNQKTIKTVISANTSMTNDKSTSSGVTTTTSSMSTTINTNAGTPVTFTASQTNSSNGNKSTTLKGAVGPSNANLFIQNTVSTNNGTSTNSTTIGGEAKIETPTINGYSAGAKAKIEVGVQNVEP